MYLMQGRTWWFIAAFLALAGVAVAISLSSWPDKVAGWAGSLAVSAAPIIAWARGAKKAIGEKLDAGLGWFDGARKRAKDIEKELEALHKRYAESPEARALQAQAEKLKKELREVKKRRLEQALAPIQEAENAAQAAATAAEAEYQRAQEAAREAEKEAAEARRAAHEASTGRVLFRFLSDRAGSADYRKHLGIVSLIRRDLLRLASWWATARTI